MVRLRSSTIKRRSSRYQGSTGRTATPDRGVPTLILNPEDPDAVQCQSCGVFVKRLAKGQPRGHAPGGYPANVRLGRYNCPGSGTTL